MKAGSIDIKSKITGENVVGEILLEIEEKRYALTVKLSRDEIKKIATIDDIVDCLNRNGVVEFYSENDVIKSEPNRYEMIERLFLSEELENNAVGIKLKKRKNLESEIMIKVL